MVKVKRQDVGSMLTLIRPATKKELIDYELAIKNVSENSMLRLENKEICFSIKHSDAITNNSEILFTRCEQNKVISKLNEER